jgi:radical SAM protein with 4Fe4S-binding SPASM domain
LPLKENVYILNPKYRLKLDKNRVLFYYRQGEPPIKKGISNFLEFQHPLFALLLTLFDGQKNLQTVTKEFAYISGMDRKSIQRLVSSLVENGSEIKIDFNGRPFYFPQNTLIRGTAENRSMAVRYNPDDFLIPNEQLDFDTRRFHEPLDAQLVLNNICVARCIYCYTDKSKPFSCGIPLQRLQEIIREAGEMGMRAFHVSGGELFTYKHWREILIELVDNNFDPYISTKYPLDETTLEELRNIGVRRIQFSIDTVDKEEMCKMLRVKESYYQRIMNTLQMLNKLGFEIRVNGQITSINQDSMEAYFNYLLQFENVRHIRVRPTAYSRFPKGVPYDSIRPSQEKLAEIEEMVLKLGEKNEENKERANLLFFKVPKQSDFKDCTSAVKQDLFRQRPQCSGNFFCFVILANGKVTVCEELYHHPRFIIGDVMSQSIREVWNSDEALSLYRLSQDVVSHESPCKTCTDFHQCHQGSGVCWKLVLNAYGEDKWDYPDPRCQNAPEPIHRFWINSPFNAAVRSGTNRKP